MNRSRLIGGTIMLSIAALLTALNFTLPPENLMFMVGDENMPFIPPIVLGVIGIIMLATSGKPKEEKEEKEIVVDDEKAALNKRMETIAWGVYLIMLGAFIFLRRSFFPGGYFSICVGVLLLGLNLARYLYGLKMSGFTTVLGILSIFSGVLQIMGLHDLEGAVFLIVLGGVLLVKPMVEKKQLFGKAEEK